MALPLRSTGSHQPAPTTGLSLTSRPGTAPEPRRLPLSRLYARTSARARKKLSKQSGRRVLLRPLPRPLPLCPALKGSPDQHRPVHLPRGAGGVSIDPARRCCCLWMRRGAGCCCRGAHFQWLVGAHSRSRCMGCCTRIRGEPALGADSGCCLVRPTGCCAGASAAPRV